MHLTSGSYTLDLVERALSLQKYGNAAFSCQSKISPNIFAGLKNVFNESIAANRTQDLLKAKPQVVASVLLLLVPLPNSGELRVLLTKRSRFLSSYPAQSCFPGGRRDANDVSVFDTALREAKEEVGVDPASVRILGQLPWVSTFQSRFYIAPVIGFCPHVPFFSLCREEVDYAWLISLRELFVSLEVVPQKDQMRPFQYFAGKGFYSVLGATARIAWMFYGRLLQATDDF